MSDVCAADARFGVTHVDSAESSAAMVAAATVFADNQTTGWFVSMLPSFTKASRTWHGWPSRERFYGSNYRDTERKMLAKMKQAGRNENDPGGHRVSRRVGQYPAASGRAHRRGKPPVDRGQRRPGCGGSDSRACRGAQAARCNTHGRRRARGTRGGPWASQPVGPGAGGAGLLVDHPLASGSRRRTPRCSGAPRLPGVRIESSTPSRSLRTLPRLRSLVALQRRALRRGSPWRDLMEKCRDHTGTRRRGARSSSRR